MSIELITLLLLSTFIILLLLGLPLAWTMGATAVIFTLLLFNPNYMVITVSRIFSSIMLSYSLVCLPLFTFMAGVLQHSKIPEQLFKAVHVWSGGVRGGLAIGTILASTFMAAMVGIVGAEIITIGMIAIPEMLNRDYDKRLALGSVTAGGGMATLIPPSIVFIVYSMVAGAPIGDLFIAGIFPGLLLALLFIAYILTLAWLKPESAPPAPLAERQMPLRAKLRLLKGLIMPSALAFVVLGSIYGGIATPTEASGIGCVGAILCAAANRQLSWNVLKSALYQTTKVSCFIAWLLFGAQAIIGVYTLAGGDDFVRNAVTSLPGGNWGVLIGMQLILIFLGMFIDWIGVCLLTMPLFVPIVLELGYDNVWFGVVFCMNMHISYLSPPFGPAVFLAKSVSPEHISVSDIYRANMPYLWLTVVALVLTMVFPELSLWLPAKMVG
jgi:tripartite ATP-independent transporter DctM subunit